jgi:cytochrome c oxidase subunit III
MEGPHGQVVQLFYFLYFMMTGVHGLHVTIGIVLVSVMAVRAWKGAFSRDYYTPVELTGLYWHFVDLVWIFLYPLIYLVGRSG